jgi:twitching motility protein PilI
LSESQAAFNTLLDLATRSRQAARGLPSQIDVQETWSGIGFSILGNWFVTPMGQIS